MATEDLEREAGVEDFLDIARDSSFKNEHEVTGSLHFTIQSPMPALPIVTESIVSTVLFIIENDYLTGEVIRVDGGRLINSF